MSQVVTNENLVEFVTTGKVAEFTPPEAAKAQDGKAPATTEKAATPAAEGSEGAGDLHERNADGTFKGKADKPAGDTDADEADLPERVRRQIGKKHRQMMEAQEFARERDRDAAAAETRAAALQRELEAFRKGQKSQGPDSTSSDSGDPDEPKQEDFKTVGEYTRALTKYEVAKAARIASEQGEKLSREQKQQAEANAIADSFAKRQAAFIEQNPEYEDVLSESDIDVPQVALQYIVESEMGPQLAVHLAKNPGDAERLSKLTPARVIAELGKLEARIEAGATPARPAAAPPVKQVSKAPAPVQPLSSDSGSVATKDPSTMSFQELRVFREAQRKAGTYRV